jgi:chorismate lyase/3-hydroxybenzoate synthase
LNSPKVIASRAFASGLPHMEYRKVGADEVLPAGTLCAIGFDARPAAADREAPRGLRVHVNLPTLVPPGVTELWHVEEAVEVGGDGGVRFACGGRYLAGQVEIDEQAAGGLEAAAREAYEAISRFTARNSHRHLLRMYNYFSDINRGEGDAERYKLFCAGRAAGFQALPNRSLPAATAIGRQATGRSLLVYWLASDEPGRPLENPRQISAFHYPRQYGPTPPSFSRAMQVADGMLISGTASVLGHTSHHPDDLPAQLDEILRNLASLRQAGSDVAPPHSGRGTLLKIYLRNARDAGFVASYLRERLPQAQLLILGADICRRELLVEIDAVHLGAGT